MESRSGTENLAEIFATVKTAQGAPLHRSAQHPLGKNRTGGVGRCQRSQRNGERVDRSNQSRDVASHAVPTHTEASVAAAAQRIEYRDSFERCGFAHDEQVQHRPGGLLVQVGSAFPVERVLQQDRGDAQTGQVTGEGKTSGEAVIVQGCHQQDDPIGLERRVRP